MLIEIILRNVRNTVIAKRTAEDFESVQEVLRELEEQYDTLVCPECDGKGQLSSPAYVLAGNIVDEEVRDCPSCNGIGLC